MDKEFEDKLATSPLFNECRRLLEDLQRRADEAESALRVSNRQRQQERSETRKNFAELRSQANANKKNIKSLAKRTKNKETGNANLITPRAVHRSVRNILLNEVGIASNEELKELVIKVVEEKATHLLRDQLQSNEVRGVLSKLVSRLADELREEGPKRRTTFTPTSKQVMEDEFRNFIQALVETAIRERVMQGMKVQVILDEELL